MKSSCLPAFLNYKNITGDKIRCALFVCKFSYWHVYSFLFVETMVFIQLFILLWINDAVLFLLSREVKAI